MAVVQPALSDFVLFPREQFFFDMSDERADETFANFPFNMDQDIHQDFLDLAGTTFASYPSTAAYSSIPVPIYDTPHLVVEGPKDSSRQLHHQRYTPSASPSTSMSHSLDHAPSTLSSTSCASVQSTASSAVGSPYSHATHSLPGPDQWMDHNQGLGIAPGVLHCEGYRHDTYPLQAMENEQVTFDPDRFTGNFVDPSLIQPTFDTPVSYNTTAAPYPGMIHAFHPPSHMFHPPSPAPSDESSQESHRTGSNRFKNRHSSPYLRSGAYHPYPPTTERRRLSMSSVHSRYSQDSPRSVSVGYDEEGKERGRCPNPDCNRLFKDLKAHMLTHQSERPEKCPIVTCEYHQKGFARKYDKQRHTLTHYKGTMVCGFCPGSGSAAEKSFNRADVFKRHLTSVHGVEQSQPNSRKKSPFTGSTKKNTSYPSDSTGKCSTCSATFNNAQEFYEHLDECVLRVVQQEEPSEAINERCLAEVASDQAVQETLGRHLLPTGLEHTLQSETSFEEDDEDEDEDEAQEGINDERIMGSGNANQRSGKGAMKSSKRASS